MRCPNCETDLISSHRQGVDVNYCPECRGVWLEKGELDKVVEAASRDRPPEDPHTLLERERRHNADMNERLPRRTLVEDIFNIP